MKLPSAAAIALLLAGCAGFSADGGFGTVAQLTQERTGQVPLRRSTPEDEEVVRVRTDELLAAPLNPDGAVELALLNNRGLQASFQQLGIAESELVRVGRLRNPSFSFGRLSGGGKVEVERAVIFDVMGLLTMPLATGVEQERFEQVRLQSAGDAVRLAARARRAWVEAVAAQELVTYFEQVMEAADASAELARRMLAAGNFSKLAQMREQAFHADATADLARARLRAVTARENLLRVLGLPDESQRLALPMRLPALPRALTDLADAEQRAMEERLDLLMARRSTATLAASLGLTRKTRMVNVLHLGYANASETGEERKDGYEIELELPLFDFGSTRLARAEAAYMQAVHRTAQAAIDARSEVRRTHAAYRTAHGLALHYRDEVVPLRKRISEENLLRYNGMLIGVFELLADAREQVASVAAAVEALRDFWLAEADLDLALTAGAPGGAAIDASGPPGTATARAAGSTGSDSH
jgi:outer membrane protein TolC